MLQSLAPRVVERRACPRACGKQRVDVYDAEDALEQVYAGWIVDRSQGGVCLSLRHSEIEEGSVLALRPPSAPPFSRGVEVRVMNRRQKKEGTVFLGCVFVRSQSIGRIGA